MQSEIEQQVLGPGGRFEIVEEPVLGVPLQVFRNRPRSARELFEQIRAFGDDEYLVLGEQRITFAEHYDRVAACAQAFRERYDLRPGDRVGILGANTPEWLQAYWATVNLGGVAAAFNGWWTAPEIEYGLQLVKPRLLVGDRKRLARLAQLEGDPGVPVLEFESDFPELFASHVGSAMPDAEIAEDDPGIILFTSGTTGFPKGAVLSHRAMVGFVQVPDAVKTLQLTAAGIDASMLPRETLLVTTPFFHVSGVFAIGVLAMVNGSKCVLRAGAFDPEDALRLIERERITGWAALGSSGPLVARHPKLADYDTSSLTRISFGGAPTSPAIANEIRAAFPNAAQTMGTAYGLSESCALGTMIGGAEYEQYPDSSGRAIPTVELDIRDERGKSLPPGEKGEIYLRNPYVMLEYWANPEATRKTITPDRWVATGDVGHVENGLLYVHSRERDLILRSAENIYPAEIENRLELHDEVAEAAVIGVDHEVHGQEVKAVVVRKPGSRLDEAGLDAWCRETLAGFKVPTLWEFRSEGLPRNASGKVLKTVLSGETAEPDADE